MVNKPTAIILAGGLGSRLGGVDKGLLQINGHKLIELCIDNLRSQAGRIVISANRNLPIYQQFADIVVPDTSAHPDYSGGPLAGILSAWSYLEQIQPEQSGDLLTVPCDMPLLPKDLVTRFYQHRSSQLQSHKKRVVVAHDGNRLQPLCTLLPWSAKNQLEKFFNSGQRKALDWLQYAGALIADFSDEAANFININTPADVNILSKNLRNHVCE
jgi:molybdenum cofactor guanylyltransferase